HGALAGLPEGPFRLPVPLAERVGSVVVAPGTVEVPRRADGLNAGGAIQGGLVAFAAEEAATSSTQGPTALTSYGAGRARRGRGWAGAHGTRAPRPRERDLCSPNPATRQCVAAG
ncbi:hypothetical protein MXD62_09875, partial [Frankia sp. Mgl5]|nr:hypothetical protein [Frankia sp. Mgl5]